MAKTKKRKKKGSLPDIWERIHETVTSYGGKKIPDKELAEELSALNNEINSSGVPSLIADNFVKPYVQTKKDVEVIFSSTVKTEEDEKWGVSFVDEGERVLINPIGLHSLYLQVLASVKDDLPEETDFENRRRVLFHRELAKLPGPYFIFIAVLGGISMRCQVFTAEKRGGRKVTPGVFSMESYFPLLWALKQFENFYRRIQNRDMRSDFGVIWHEGEWVEKK